MSYTRAHVGGSSVDVLQCDFCGLVRLSEVVDDLVI